MNNANTIEDPYKLARKQYIAHGKAALVDMVRVGKLLAKGDGELEYSLSFALDVDGVCFITGRIHGPLAMRCQRCLQIFCHNMQSEFIVSPVLNDGEDRLLSSEYEPVIIHDNKLDIMELLEDELILALPQVPMHNIEDANCKRAFAVTYKVEYEAQEMRHPFQVLQKLNLKKNGQMAEDNQNGGTTES